MSTATLGGEHRYDIAGVSQASESIRAGIASVASSRVHVVISGESGTGKRHVAKQIHLSSSKSPGSFYEILPETQDAEVNAVLFNDDRRRLEGMRGRPLPILTQTSTVFVKNVHQFSVAGQSWIGRAMMQSSLGKFSPRFRVVLSVPMEWSTLIKGRFIAQSVADAVKTSEHIAVPPLRSRTDDINQFIDAFVKAGAPGARLQASAETLRELSSYHWHDNVRELRHLIEEALSISPGNELILPTGFVDEITTISETLGSIMGGKKVALPEVLESLEKSLLRRALLRTNYDKMKASNLLGLTYVCVDSWLKKHDFHHPEIMPARSRAKSKTLK